MSQTVCILLNPADRVQLEAIVSDRNRPLKHVQRAMIILFSAERLTVQDVARRVGSVVPASGAGNSGLARKGQRADPRQDKTRPPGKAPLGTSVAARVLALACSEPPGSITQWTGRAVAGIIGISLRSVQRIWEAHRLQPHRLRTFKKSSDPAFAQKVEDIVGLYMSPPAHAIVVSIDEKSQIQALESHPARTAAQTGKMRQNADPKPFLWTKSANDIFVKLDEIPVPSV